MTVLRDSEREAAIAREASAADDGELLVLVAELILASGLASRQMIHRKLRIGWDAAGKLLDGLQARGIVGEDVGDPRDILTLPEDIEATLETLRAEAGVQALEKLGIQPLEDLETGDPEPGDEGVEEPGDQALEDLETSDPEPGVSLTKAAGERAPVEPGEPAPFKPGPGAALAKRRAASMAARQETAPAERAGYDLEEGAEGDASTPEEKPRQHLIARVVQDGYTTLRDGDGPKARAARTFARYWWVTGQGIWSWLVRATKAANHGHAREQLAMARLSADPDQVERWLKDLDVLRNNRIKRWRQMPQAIAALGISAVVVVGIVAFLSLLVGIFAAIVWGWPGWDLWWWFFGWAVIIAMALCVVWAFLTLALAVPTAIAAAHKEGLKMKDPPRWLMPLDMRELGDTTITPHRVILALQHSKIPALRTYIKASPDGGAELLGPITQEGDGVGVEVRLPGEVSTDDVKKQRKRIAENADRHEHELFITVPKAHHVHLWFADTGALERALPPSPLVTATTPIRANMRTGKCPWGRTVRGQEVGINLWQQMLLITGLSNQGKTKAIRALALWLAFDWRVTFWIADLKGQRNDWGMFRDLCPEGYFVAGPGEDEVIAATLMVEAAVAEMQRRMTSERDGSDWPPIVVIVDEAQVAYASNAYDEDGNPFGGTARNSRYLNAVLKLKQQGRAVNVVIWEGTQDPTNENLPKRSREGSHIRISLVVGTEEQSKMALGAAAVGGGAAPHLLRKDVDKGWVVMHGGDAPIPLGEASVTVRTYFIDDPEAWQVAGRAIGARNKRRSQPVIDAVEDGEPVDHLMHIWEAMRGESQLRTVAVLARLMEDRPELYEGWDTQDTARVVDAYAAAGLDIGIRKRGGGQRVLVLEELEEALRARSEVLP